MEVQTHEMDPRIARIHYKDYLNRVRSHREKRKKKLEEQGKAAGRELGRVRIEKTKLEREDEELKAAYLELSREKRVVILPEAMKKVGIDSERCLPRLAIAKADSSWCFFDGSRMIYDRRRNDRHQRTAVFSWSDRPYFAADARHSICLEQSIFGPRSWNTRWRLQQREVRQRQISSYPVKAMVPKVPPRLAPDDLSKYYILFEPKWENEPPHLDPILLSRSSETVFVIVAVWDMTPLEASILDSTR